MVVGPSTSQQFGPTACRAQKQQRRLQGVGFKIFRIRVWGSGTRVVLAWFISPFEEVVKMIVESLSVPGCLHIVIAVFCALIG